MRNLCLYTTHFRWFSISWWTKEISPKTTKQKIWNTRRESYKRQIKRHSPYKCCQPILLLHPFPWFWLLFNVHVGLRLLYKSARAMQSHLFLEQQATNYQKFVISFLSNTPAPPLTTIPNDTLKYLKWLKWPRSLTKRARFICTAVKFQMIYL